MLRAGATLRQTARHLEQNYDLALGVLNTLVANVVGPNGIGVDRLAVHGIWLEHPEATPGWSHWQSVGVRSGNRVFRP